MRYSATLAVLLCCSSAQAIDLWAPIGGEYRYEVEGQVYTGQYPMTFQDDRQDRFAYEEAGVWSTFIFIDAGHIGYITSTVRADQPASMEGWFDFTSPDGYSFKTGRHPTAGPAATGYYLDGVEMEYGVPILVTPGTHRMSFSLAGSGVGGANLEVTPVPEPSAAWLLLLGMPLWWWIR